MTIHAKVGVVKKCAGECKLVLPASAFGKNVASMDNLNTRCIVCNQRHSRKNNPENWKLARAAKALYGKERIKKSAHGRYVESEFTSF